MVETRMDAMISRLSGQPPQVARPRPAPPSNEQVLKARPVEAKNEDTVESEEARIFAKRSFQTATAAESSPAEPPKEGPRGGNLDILA